VNNATRECQLYTSSEKWAIRALVVRAFDFGHRRLLLLSRRADSDQQAGMISMAGAGGAAELVDISTVYLACSAVVIFAGLLFGALVKEPRPAQSPQVPISLAVDPQ
jgi:hypothetical protein